MKSNVTGSPTVFQTLTIENSTGIAMKVTVEAPIGTTIVSARDVAPGSTVTINPYVNDVSSVLIKADFGNDHGEYTESLTLDGRRIPVFLEEAAAVARIGDVIITAVKGGHPRPR